MTEQIDADARRSRPAYRAAVWLYRLMLAVAVVYVIALATQAVPLFGGLSGALFVLLYGACLVSASVLFARAGVRIVARPVVRDGLLGNTDEIKANRKIVWRDVFARGR